MRKQLSEMTLEELWELFPIILTKHKDDWTAWYGEEADRIHTFLHIYDCTVSHIGSTAIRSIQAKPIIDILVEISADTSMEAVKEMLVSNGYCCMCEDEKRKDFNRGYTSDGFADKVFHLHLRFSGDNDELYFRDYMNDCPAIAKQYEELKLTLKNSFEHNRDAYTDGKEAFVRQYTKQAKKKYGKRYCSPANCPSDENRPIIVLRPFEPTDLPIFKKWLYVPHVARWYSDPLDWIAEAEDRNGSFQWIHRFVIEADAVHIGCCQYYACRDSGEDWSGYEIPDGAYSIDYVIGEPDYLGRGFGKRTVFALVDMIKKLTDAHQIIVQPDPGNAASRRTLISCGFSHIPENDVFVLRL